MIRTLLQCFLVNQGKSFMVIGAVEQQSGPDYNSDKVKACLLLPGFPFPSNFKYTLKYTLKVNTGSVKPV